MSDTNTEVPPQPAPTEQSGEKTSAANLDHNAMVRMLSQKEQAQAKAAVTTEDKPSEKESAPPVTEETEISSPAESAEPKSDDSGETEEAGEVLSHETLKLDPKIQEKINRRVGKEVGKTKRALQAQAKAEQERDQYKSQLAELQGKAQAQPQQPQTLEQIESLTDLATLEREAMLTVRWVDDQLDRDDFPHEGIKTQEGILTKADLKALRRNARIALEDQIPQRKAFLAEQDAARAKAHEAFPFLKDKTAPEYAEVEAALKANPWLKNVPNADWIIGVQIMGLRAMEAAKKGTPTKVAAPKPKPMAGQTQVASDASPSRVLPGAVNGAAISELTNRLRAKGGASEKDMAAFLRDTERIRLSS